jgi:universal stress protein A
MAWHGSFIALLAMKRIERILVPIDFSEPSKAALDHAIGLAQRKDAALELLHVWEGHSYAGGGSFDHVWERGSHVSQALIEFSQTERGRELERWMDKARAGGVSVRARLESGDPAGVIVRVALEGGHDRIVMGSHGRRGFAHLLLGSVAEHVLARAKCPALVIGRDGTVQGESKSIPKVANA